MALSIEEKYDEVRQLITMGKEKGYLLYEEVNDMLPSEISSSDELDDIFSMFGQMGIEVGLQPSRYPWMPCTPPAGSLIWWNTKSSFPLR